jgi:hypothetical protein
MQILRLTKERDLNLPAVFEEELDIAMPPGRNKNRTKYSILPLEMTWIQQCHMQDTNRMNIETF